MTTYTNITLLDVEQAEAVDWLTDNGHTAAVSPTIDNLTVIYDNILADYEAAAEPIEELLKLASELSYELGCVAWLVIVDDDNALIYSLYEGGDLLDSYGSARGQVPDGGTAERLADIYGAPKRAIKTVRTILRREMDSATDRHAQLLEALSLPALAVGASYERIAAGQLPNGVDNLDDIIVIAPDDTDPATPPASAADAPPPASN